MEKDGIRALPSLHCMKCGHRGLIPKSDPINPHISHLVCSSPSCDWTFYNNPLPIVACVVEQIPSHRLILVRGVNWPSTWFGVVTGFVENKEDTEHAAVREVKEELGLDGRVVASLGVASMAERNHLFIGYHVQVRDDQQATLQADEIAEVKYVPFDELKPWDRGTGIFVKRFIEMRKKENGEREKQQLAAKL